MSDLSAYAEDKSAPTTDASIAVLKRLAQEQAEAEALVAELIEQLEKAKAALVDVSERKIPSAMQSLGITAQTFDTGLHVEIKEHVFTSIPKEKQTIAYAWIDEQGDGGIIKRTFVIKFNRDEEDWASKFARDLGQRKKPVKVEITRKIESATLKAYGRDKLAGGIALPEEGFSVMRKNIAEISIKTR